MKKILFVLIMFAMAISCGGSKGGNSLTLNLGGEPDSIDPQVATGISGGTVDDLIIEGLARKDRDGKSIPGIAEKWDVSEDGLEWTFHLRDAKWSNGDKVTAQDFKAGWLRALNPATASENAGMMFMIKGAEEYNSKNGKPEDVAIEAVDEKTLKVTLKTPTPYFDDLITFKTYMPLNEKFYAEKKDKYFTEAENTLSNGAYLLKSWVHDSELVFEKNPEYWDASNVKVDKVTLKLMTDAAASVNAFKNGELDLVGLTNESLKEFADDKRLVKAGDGGIYYLLFNTNVPALKNAKIRRALTMAVDRKRLVSEVLGGTERYSETFVPAGIGMKGISKDFTEEVPTRQVDFNPEEAKKLLAEGLQEAGLSQLPELEMIFGDSGNNKSVAEFIQENLRTNLGVNLKVSGIQGKERIARTKQRNYEISLQNWTGDFRDPITYLDLFASQNASNRGDYKNARYDELVQTVKSTADPAVRVPAMIEMEKIISEENPVGILYQKQKKYLVDPKVTGLGFVAIGGEFNFKDLEVKK